MSQHRAVERTTKMFSLQKYSAPCFAAVSRLLTDKPPSRYSLEFKLALICRFIWMQVYKTILCKLENLSVYSVLALYLNHANLLSLMCCSSKLKQIYFSIFMSRSVWLYPGAKSLDKNRRKGIRHLRIHEDYNLRISSFFPCFFAKITSLVFGNSFNQSLELVLCPHLYSL